MREVVIHATCDACWQDGEQRVESAGAWSVAITQGESSAVPKVLVIDLCDQHAKLVTDLMDILANVEQLPAPVQMEERRRKAPAPATTELTTRQKAAERASRKVPCPVCHADIKRFDMVRHVWSYHRTDPRPPAPKKCPECGVKQVHPAGMATHRRIAHGHDALAEALSGVEGYVHVPAGKSSVGAGKSW